jgi:hypothetical protein
MSCSLDITHKSIRTADITAYHRTPIQTVQENIISSNSQRTTSHVAAQSSVGYRVIGFSSRRRLSLRNREIQYAVRLTTTHCELLVPYRRCSGGRWHACPSLTRRRGGAPQQRPCSSAPPLCGGGAPRARAHVRARVRCCVSGPACGGRGGARLSFPQSRAGAESGRPACGSGGHAVDCCGRGARRGGARPSSPQRRYATLSHLQQLQRAGRTRCGRAVGCGHLCCSGSGCGCQRAEISSTGRWEVGCRPRTSAPLVGCKSNEQQRIDMKGGSSAGPSHLILTRRCSYRCRAVSAQCPCCSTRLRRECLSCWSHS